VLFIANHRTICAAAHAPLAPCLIERLLRPNGFLIAVHFSQAFQAKIFRAAAGKPGRDFLF
jgi:hypothetical protein